MDTKSQREVRLIDGAWSITQIMASLAKALVSDGPALGFGAVSSQVVEGKVAVLVSSTGSTGANKEYFLSAGALLASAKAANKYLAASAGETWSLLLPLTHIAAVNVLVRSLELGTIPVNLISHSGEFPRADYTAIVPTQLYNALTGDERLLNHLKSAKAVLVGGAALTAELATQASAAGINVVTTYGMSETSGGFIYNDEPLEGVQVAISDSGFIKIKGAVLASNLSLDSENWFTTSDLGELVDGKLKVLGRGDDVIVSGGENISLTEIENTISETFANLEFAAFAINSEKWGQELHIAVVNSPSDFNATVEQILLEKFGNAAKPKGFHQLAALPLIGIGKVDRRALAQSAMKLGS
jgi:O-succinylbenzoic acid--CoA ligase